MALLRAKLPDGVEVLLGERTALARHHLGDGRRLREGHATAQRGVLHGHRIRAPVRVHHQREEHRRERVLSGQLLIRQALVPDHLAEVRRLGEGLEDLAFPDDSGVASTAQGFGNACIGPVFADVGSGDGEDLRARDRGALRRDAGRGGGSERLPLLGIPDVKSQGGDEVHHSVPVDALLKRRAYIDEDRLRTVIGGRAMALYLREVIE